MRLRSLRDTRKTERAIMMKRADLYILTAAALWGCIGIFLKRLTAAGLTSMQSVAVRSLAAASLCLLWILCTDRAALRIRLRDCGYFIGTGIFSLVFFNWCYFNAIQASSMAVAAVLLYTSPVFVMLMSALFFRESVTPLKIIALAVTLAGCALVTGLLPPGGAPVSLSTILFGLGSGFGYALYTIFGKLALEKYPSSTVTLYTFLFALLGSLPLSGLWNAPELLLDRQVILAGLGIGVFCCILPYLLYTEGLRRAQAGKAAILATAEPFVAALIGIFLYREEVTIWKLLGMCAILGAIALLNRGE